MDIHTNNNNSNNNTLSKLKHNTLIYTTCPNRKCF